MQGVEVKAVHVRNHMLLFVNCLVENPAFGSQTKDTLTTQAKDFGSSPILSDKFIKAVLASGIVDRVLAWARFKATTDLQKATGGKRGASKFLGLPKLDDANHAGTAKGPVSGARQRDVMWRPHRPPPPPVAFSAGLHPHPHGG